VFAIEPSTNGNPIPRADFTAVSSPPTDLLMAERLFPDDSSFITVSTIDCMLSTPFPISVLFYKREPGDICILQIIYIISSEFQILKNGLVINTDSLRVSPKAAVVCLLFSIKMPVHLRLTRNPLWFSFPLILQ
jgi:hypothetical protein